MSSSFDCRMRGLVVAQWRVLLLRILVPPGLLCCFSILSKDVAALCGPPALAASSLAEGRFVKDREWVSALESPCSARLAGETRL
jgi:hypothetical protein